MSLTSRLVLLLGLLEVSAVTLKEGSSFEWAGTFATPSAAYEWIAEKKVCHYADAHMKVVVLSVPDATAAGSESALAGMEAAAETAVAGTCSEIKKGETFTQSSTTCYELHFDTTSAISKFTLATGGAGHIAIFTQHVPTEFESTQHYFQLAGADVEPIKEIKMANAPAGGGHAAHGRRLSGTEAYEWAGTFATPDPIYYWTAQKVNGDYVDPGMKMVLLPATGTDAASLDALESTADTLLAGTCTAVASGNTIVPSTLTCYQLNFGCSVHTSFFPLDTSSATNIAVFAEHHPIEFERDAHYLKDKKGGDIEPEAELPKAAPSPPAPDKPWGNAIGAAIIVNVCTLLGIVLLVPGINSFAKNSPNTFFCTLNGFSAGAIISCTFFLLLFEATHLVPLAGEAEAATTGKWGAMVITGFLSPIVLDIIMMGVAKVLCSGKGGGSKATAAPAKSSSSSSSSASTSSSSSSSASAVSPPPSPPPSEGEEVAKSQSRILGGVLLGDFMHNFVDGIFIGMGFQFCPAETGWKITTATVAHELAQELADFVILVDPRQGGLKAPMALFLNFLSGISVIIGVIVVLAGNPSNEVMGMLLAFGGGIYIHVAAAECMSDVYVRAKSLSLLVLALLFFAIGAMAIGVVLVNHEHCFPPAPAGAADPHAGHNHGRMLSSLGYEM